MQDLAQPADWRDIAASYDPRGLPFLHFFEEQGMTQKACEQKNRIFAQAANFGSRS